MKQHVKRILNHIEILCALDRIMCSDEYDRALDYVIANIHCTEDCIHLEEFQPGTVNWGWTVPASMGFWRDSGGLSPIEIPNQRSMKILNVLIPGQSDEEIIMVAHLDHPKPSANDNASGVAMMMELINYFFQHPQYYALRFLFTIEYFGTVAFCSRYESELPKIIAGISLDMVGADQNQCGSTMIIDEIPHNLTSCIDLILWNHLLKGARSGAYREIGNPVMEFRLDYQYYTGGSDHYILNDSTVGIPSTCLNCYPDRFYHSKGDTLDKISFKTLKLFFSSIIKSLNDISDISTTGLNRIAQLVLQRYTDVAHVLLLELSSNDDLELEEFMFRVGHIFSHSRRRIESLRRVFGTDVPDFWSKQLNDCYGKTIERFRFLSGREFEVFVRDNEPRYRRRFKGPLYRNRLYELISSKEKERLDACLSDDPLFFHKIDAALNYCKEKGISEISWLLRFHYGGDSIGSKIKSFFDLLCNIGLMEVVRGNG